MTVSDSFVRQGYLGVEQERCQCPWLTRDHTGPASTAREPPAGGSRRCRGPRGEPERDRSHRPLLRTADV